MISRIARLSTHLFFLLAANSVTAAQSAVVPNGNDTDPATIANGFVAPPDSCRPWVYAFFLNGNITRGGITADLEAMKRAGIGGMTVMEVDQGSPRGPVDFMSDEWRALFKHLVAEAGRLGLEVNLNNGAGWNGSGGPWMPLDQAMQLVVTSETQVQSGRKFEGELPKPPANKINPAENVNETYYRDISVLAFPTPVDPDNPAWRIKELDGKRMSYGWVPGGTDPGNAIPAENLIPKAGIVDLTARMDAGGKLRWDAPALPNSGEWTVIRFGHTFKGQVVHPAPKPGVGPECDKLSKQAIETHYHGILSKLVKDVGPLAGKVLVSTHVDSCEHGAQNWTPKMPAEFKRLRGYDMMPFMPVICGRVVDSLDISERFLEDFRQTVSDMYVENYIGHLRNLAHKDGLRLSVEAYRNPANDLDIANQVDEPMAEFWADETNDNIYWVVKAMSSAAHVNGRPVVAAEAFTCMPGERWLAHPATLKALGDRAFCDGVNRFVFHRYAMQPWAETRMPGMTMGPYGVHYERGNTWWEDSNAWHQYVTRCQYMLRQGKFVADVLWLRPEELMERLWNRIEAPGHDYDALSPHAFMKDVGVRDGMLELQSGMKYRLLVLPEYKSMTVMMLNRIKDLVEAGATIVGMPPVHSRGLAGYPKSDEEIREIAKALWGSVKPTAAGERKFGKGRVVWGKPVAEVLAGMGVARDFVSSKPLRYIHREVNGMDVYFVSNQTPQKIEAVCTFRVSGKQPELWDPVTGEQRDLPEFEQKDGCAAVPLKFDPSGSMFVVFRNEAGKIQVTTTNRNFPELKTVREIAGPWSVQFDPQWSGLTHVIAFDQLDDWAKRPEEAIKYFSGSAVYHKVFDLAAEVRSQKSEVGTNNSDLRPLISDLAPRLYLDLGKVAIMAAVKLNGKDLGTLWKAPYSVDITHAIKAGENVLEIRVVNLLINRMIGDEFLPEDSERTTGHGAGVLKDMKWPQWIQEGKPSPTGRYTFSTWRGWKKEDPLQESGLLGPVTVRTEALPP